jgi:hypothetical protein
MTILAEISKVLNPFVCRLISLDSSATRMFSRVTDEKTLKLSTMKVQTNVLGLDSHIFHQLYCNLFQV